MPDWLTPKNKRDFALFTGGAVAGAALTFYGFLMQAHADEQHARDSIRNLISHYAEAAEDQRTVNRFRSLSWSLLPVAQGGGEPEAITAALEALAAEISEWSYSGDVIEHGHGGTITVGPSARHSGMLDVSATGLPERVCIYLLRDLLPAAAEIGTGDSFTSFKPGTVDDRILSSITNCQQPGNTVNFTVGLS